MRARSIILLGISLVLGFVVIQWVRGDNQAPVQAAAPTIVVAATNLNFGDHIGRTDLRMVKWPEDAIPKGAFTDINELIGPGEDRVVLRAIDAGEPISPAKISGSGARATLSTIIDKEMRAVTIRVTDATGVAGFVLPGDRVDVLLTRDENHGNGQETDILLQNVKVLGIDQEASDRREKPAVVKAVTLEVTPEDTQKLTLGAGIGTLSLALRNVTDPQPVVSRTLTAVDLRPTQPKLTTPLASAPPPPVYNVRPRTQIEILRGTESRSYEVNPGGAAVKAARAGQRATEAPAGPSAKADAVSAGKKSASTLINQSGKGIDRLQSVTRLQPPVD